jgi:hypothetical protein
LLIFLHFSVVTISVFPHRIIRTFSFSETTTSATEGQKSKNTQNETGKGVPPEVGLLLDQIGNDTGSDGISTPFLAPVLVVLRVILVGSHKQESSADNCSNQNETEPSPTAHVDWVLILGLAEHKDEPNQSGNGGNQEQDNSSDAESSLRLS